MVFISIHDATQEQYATFNGIEDQSVEGYRWKTQDIGSVNLTIFAPSREDQVEELKRMVNDLEVEL